MERIGNGSMKLTGLMRCQLRIIWLKRGKDIDFEEYVKKVCKAKSITYAAPKPVERTV